MLDSYLFIPGDKERFLNKMEELNPDYFVIDLEDSVSNNRKKIAFTNVMNQTIALNTFIRIPYLDNCFTNQELFDLSLKSNGKIVIPKISSVDDFKNIFKYFKEIDNLKLIILVESSKCLVNLKGILDKYSNHIFAITFGNHDFCSETGIKNKTEYINPIKLQLCILAKAYGVKVLDGVDVNIRKFEGFEKECLFAFEVGMEGKFLIHPDQLNKITNLEYYSSEELALMKKIYASFIKNGVDELDILEFEGVIYEKPHLKRIVKIISKIK